MGSYISAKEFGRRTNLSLSHVYNMLRDGRLQAVKIGGCTRISEDAALAAMKPWTEAKGAPVRKVA